VPHRWVLTPRQAIAVQKKLADQVLIESAPCVYRWIAGLDAAFSDGGRTCLAGVVLWDLQTGQVAESHLARRPVRFPYIPGLLSFREAPALIAALRQLQTTPDAIMCDGQGLAHPRRFGIACHVGLLCDLPSVGCAKSRLIGEHAEPARAKGSWTALIQAQETIGAVVRTQQDVRPVYVSIGHRIDLPTAVSLALASACRFRLPEPTRLADRLVAVAKRIAWTRAE
jgi:deoxyribonuclease V